MHWRGARRIGADPQPAEPGLRRQRECRHPRRRRARRRAAEQRHAGRARLAGGTARGRLRRRRHRHRDAAVERRDDPELSRPERRQPIRRTSPRPAGIDALARRANGGDGDRHSGRRRLLPVHPPRLPGCGRAAARRRCSPRAMARRTTSACARATWAGGTSRRPACSSRMSAGSRSAPAARHLRARNEALLERLHPGYAELIQAHASADPLAEARRRLDLARWRAMRRRGQRCGDPDHPCGRRRRGAPGRGLGRAASRAAAAAPSCCGRRARPTAPRASPSATARANGFPNLRYAMPGRAAGPAPPARPRARPRAIELHHLVGHHPAVLDLLAGTRRAVRRPRARLCLAVRPRRAGRAGTALLRRTGRRAMRGLRRRCRQPDRRGHHRRRAAPALAPGCSPGRAA